MLTLKTAELFARFELMTTTQSALRGALLNNRRYQMVNTKTAKNDNRSINVSFERDGHMDSIGIFRNSQRAGTIEYVGGEWRVSAHAKLERTGSVETVTGCHMNQTAKTHSTTWSGNSYKTLNECLTDVLQRDKKAKLRDINEEADFLLRNFRKFTAHKNAA